MSNQSVTKVMQRLFIFATVILLSFQGFMVNIPNVQAGSEPTETESAAGSKVIEVSESEFTLTKNFIEAMEKSVLTSSQRWFNNTIEGDLYIGPKAVMEIRGNVVVNGDLYVLGSIVNYGSLRVNGTINTNKMVTGGTLQPYYNGLIQNIGGRTSFEVFRGSNQMLAKIPFEIIADTAVSTNGIVENLKGSTLPIVDVTAEGKAVELERDGSFTIDKLDLGDKESITFKFTDIFGNTITKVVPVKVVDTISPTVTIDNKGGYFGSAKTVTLTISEAGSVYYTLDGTLPSAASTGYDAPIEITSDAVLKYIAVDNAGNESEIYTEDYIFFDVNGITDKSTEITGTAQAKSTIKATNDKEEWTTTADAAGAYKVDIPVQSANTLVKVNAINENGIISETIELVVKDVTAPAKPVVNEVTDQSEKVTGEAEAKSTVSINANNKEVGQVTAKEDGTFEAAIATQKGGTELSITATDQAGNTSEAIVITVKDITAPAKPEINEVTEESTQVTGKAEAGSAVEIAVGGKEIGKGTTKADGTFTVTIPTQKVGTVLSVTATDKAGNKSDATEVTVGDSTPPEKPAVNGVTNLSTEVTGKAEAASTVTVSANNKEIKSGTTKADGTFTIAIPKQKSGTALSITATDKAGNVSETETVTVGTVTEKSTSLLGHINGGKSFIYPNSPGEVNKISSDEFKNSVYYIKKQATYQGKNYYLLSENSSATKGVIGWIEATDVTSQSHSGLDKKNKVFYVKGTGGAGFDTAWGGSKNHLFADLKAHKNKTFAVNLTEKVGNNIWYRGVLDGKQTWIHSSYVAELNSYIELSTSRLGHIKSGKSSVYSTPFNSADKKSSESLKNSVYYIKKQATYNKELYYLLSNNPSATNGVIGWMKASDISSHAHVGVNKKKETLYVKGTGGASFTRAWGGRKNHVNADLKQLKGAEFNVNLTEKVGNNIWHRGLLNGKQAWVQSKDLTELSAVYKEQSTSRLGHINSGKSLIYTEPYNQATAKSSESHKNSVYYIKKQATFSGNLYYLLSTEPNATKGVIGWMKASDVSSHAHKGLDKKTKTFYVKGTDGAGFDTAWGGSKNHVYTDLKPLKNEIFHVNLTEKVGNNTWYRGMLNGKQTWIQSNLVEDITGTYKEQSTSRLGHINGGTSLIYASPFDTAINESSNKYKNKVYYIKKQATYKGQLYYLLSNHSSATKGVIGWMKASDVSSQTHVGVDKKTKTFYVKGTGGAGYDTAWGGSKNNVYADLKPLKNTIFHVDLTEKVGNNTWYRGMLNGKQTWILSSYVTSSK